MRCKTALRTFYKNKSFFKNSTKSESIDVVHCAYYIKEI